VNSKKRSITTAIALFLVFSTAQVYTSASFAAREAGSALIPPAVPQQVTGSLTTQGNKPITLNGASAASGATIVSGASIETPAGVGATVNMGGLGSLQIDPNTKLTVEFQNGSIKVMLLSGCVILNTKRGTTGEVNTPQGPLGKTDPAKDDSIKVCAPGSVATVPATAAGGGGGLFGLGTAATVAILAGGAGVTAAALTLGGRGTNPSGVNP
jgi:hypothetical protein